MVYLALNFKELVIGYDQQGHSERQCENTRTSKLVSEFFYVKWHCFQSLLFIIVFFYLSCFQLLYFDMKNVSLDINDGLKLIISFPFKENVTML